MTASQAAPAQGRALTPPRNTEAGLGNQAVLRRLALSRAPAGRLMRDADGDEIEKIESEKLDINDLLKRCAALDAGQRDRMITKVGDHAATIHEERQLACLLAAKFKGVMLRADFYNTYHEVLERLDPGPKGGPGQMDAVLDYVGKAVLGKMDYNGVEIDRRGINKAGLQGAPGSSIMVDKTVYVVVDEGVQFKTGDEGGPAGRNNNPGNITVDDNAKDAWDADIGAYRGRSTDGRFAVFPTYERGRAGAKAWAARHQSLSLLDYFKQYAPKSEKGNDPDKYARTVAEAVGAVDGAPATSATPVGAIIKAGAMEAFVNGQEKAEGFTQANVTLVKWPDIAADPKLPQAVKDFVAGFNKATDNTNAVADKVAKAAANPPAAPPAP